MKLEVKGAELLKDDLRSPQSYFKTSSLFTARMAFRVQNRMLDIPADMPGRYIGRMQCSGCRGWEQEEQEEQGEQGQDEQERGPPLMTREHIDECPGFAALQPSLPVCQRPICRRNTFSAAQPSDQTISRNRATTSLCQVTIHVVVKD